MHRLERVAAAVAAAPVGGSGGHGPGSGRTAPPGELFEEVVADSDVHRTAQVAELDGYINAIKNDGSEDRLASLFTPDYSSAAGYEASCEGLREAFAKTIGYPPPASKCAVLPTSLKPSRSAQSSNTVSQSGRQSVSQAVKH